VYDRQGKKIDADPETFKFFDNCSLAKDKFNIFIDGEKIDSGDAATFIQEGEFFADKKHRYKCHWKGSGGWELKILSDK